MTGTRSRSFAQWVFFLLQKLQSWAVPPEPFNAVTLHSWLHYNKECCVVSMMARRALESASVNITEFTEASNHPSPPLDNIRVMVIVWTLRGNIIRTALCWIVWHSVHSQQHTYVSSSYRSNRLGLSHWDAYAVRRGGCLKLYYCNMVEWFWWDSSLILTTNWFPSVF